MINSASQGGSGGSVHRSESSSHDHSTGSQLSSDISAEQVPNSLPFSVLRRCSASKTLCRRIAFKVSVQKSLAVILCAGGGGGKGQGLAETGQGAGRGENGAGEKWGGTGDRDGDGAEEKRARARNGVGWGPGRRSPNGNAFCSADPKQVHGVFSFDIHSSLSP